MAQGRIPSPTAMFFTIFQLIFFQTSNVKNKLNWRIVFSLMGRSKKNLKLKSSSEADKFDYRDEKDEGRNVEIAARYREPQERDSRVYIVLNPITFFLSLCLPSRYLSRMKRLCESRQEPQSIYFEGKRDSGRAKKQLCLFSCRLLCQCIRG